MQTWVAGRTLARSPRSCCCCQQHTHLPCCCLPMSEPSCCVSNNIKAPCRCQGQLIPPASQLQGRSQCVVLLLPTLMLLQNQVLQMPYQGAPASAAAAAHHGRLLTADLHKPVLAGIPRMRTGNAPPQLHAGLHKGHRRLHNHQCCPVQKAQVYAPPITIPKPYRGSEGPPCQCHTHRCAMQRAWAASSCTGQP